jgi:hypothetical protein
VRLIAGGKRRSCVEGGPVRTNPYIPREPARGPRRPVDEEIPGPELVKIARDLADRFGRDLDLARRAANVIGLPSGLIPEGVVDACSFWWQIVALVHSGASPIGSGRSAVTRLGEVVAGSRSAVFLSYARPDRAEVERLGRALAAADPALEIFLDTFCLEPGIQWLDAIDQWTRRAGVMVCWLTEAFVRASFPHYEIGRASGSGARIIPVVRTEEILKVAPAYLSGRQFIHARDPIHHDWLAGEILRAIRPPG